MTTAARQDAQTLCALAATTALIQLVDHLAAPPGVHFLSDQWNDPRIPSAVVLAVRFGVPLWAVVYGLRRWRAARP